jgi:hypothetical protein
MPGQIREISYASSEDDSRSIYSQDELDPGDDSTIRDAENSPAGTSDEHLGVSETTPGKAQSLHDDDSSIATGLSFMLTNIKDDLVKRLARAADRALSLESQYDEDSDVAKSSYLEERLAETEKNLATETNKKSIYKDRSRVLTEKIESLIEKNESLRKANNDLSSEVDTLTAEKKAAKAKALAIFG